MNRQLFAVRPMGLCALKSCVVTSLVVLSTTAANAERLKLCADGPFYDGVSETLRLDFARNCSVLIRNRGSLTWSDETIKINFQEDTDSNLKKAWRMSISSGLYSGFFGAAHVLSYMPKYEAVYGDDVVKAVKYKWVGEFFKNNFDQFEKYADHPAYSTIKEYAEDLAAKGDANAGLAARSMTAQLAAKETERQARAQRDEAEAARNRQQEQARQANSARERQEFEAKLEKNNPGELFALADELSAQGDTERARQVRRQLISKYPNHPLAATAAQQMSMPANVASSSSQAPGSAQVNGGSSEAACGSAGEQSQRNILNRYSRFNDSSIKQIISNGPNITLVSNVRDMISRGGGVSGAIAGVAGEVENNKRQMATAMDAYCAGAICSGGVSQLGWPDKLPNTFTDSVGMMRVYAMASLFFELNSMTLRALRQCPPAR